MRRAVVLLAIGGVLVPTPASGKLAYQKLGVRNTSEGIYVARDDGSHARRVIGGYSPYLSPGGRKIAFFGKRRFGLHVVGVDGRSPDLVLRYAFDPGGLAWSP